MENKEAGLPVPSKRYALEDWRSEISKSALESLLKSPVVAK